MVVVVVVTLRTLNFNFQLDLPDPLGNGGGSDGVSGSFLLAISFALFSYTCEFLFGYKPLTKLTSSKVGLIFASHLYRKRFTNFIRIVFEKL